MPRKTGEEAAPAARPPARVLKEGPAEAFGVDPRITRDGRARLVHRGAGGVCVEYTLSEEALVEVWRRCGPPGHAEWPPRRPFSTEPDHERIERIVARALAARQ
ncbi:MAG: hypothetical protein AB1816_11170, partial [Bacillota bacterium]